MRFIVDEVYLEEHKHHKTSNDDKFRAKKKHEIRN